MSGSTKDNSLQNSWHNYSLKQGFSCFEEQTTATCWKNQNNSTGMSNKQHTERLITELGTQVNYVILNPLNTQQV